MREDGIILAVTAAEMAECRGLGLTLGRLSYRVSPAGVLLRSAGLGDETGGVMILMGEIPATAEIPTLAAAIVTECSARAYQGVFLDCGRVSPQGAALAELLFPVLTAQGRRLFTPEGLDAGITVVDSGVTGGSFARYLEETAARHPDGFALELAPLAVTYVLPADGMGESLSREDLAAILDAGYLHYYSRELAARYVTYRGQDGLTRFVLYDDADSLREKCRLAEAAGAAAILVPYSLLREELADLLEL